MCSFATKHPDIFFSFIIVKDAEYLLNVRDQYEILRAIVNTSQEFHGSFLCLLGDFPFSSLAFYS